MQVEAKMINRVKDRRPEQGLKKMSREGVGQGEIGRGRQVREILRGREGMIGRGCEKMIGRGRQRSIRESKLVFENVRIKNNGKD